MIDQLVAVMGQAGAIAREKKELHAQVKAASDYVTDADKAVDSFLIQALPKLVPGRVFTEESPIVPGDYAGNTWVVDPIDGTTNLMHHMNFSAVSVALIVDGHLRLGAVHNPFTGEMYWAQAGSGAFLDGRAIRVSPVQHLEQALIGFEIGPGSKGQQEPVLRAVGAFHQAANGVRALGSTALDLCYVACGRYSGCFWDYIHPWDYAAGMIILQEAGGRVTQRDGREMDFQGKSTMVASNGWIHDEMLRLMDHP